jgi:pimeloyl-ACP methyl ester carboxylesterase
MDTIVLIHGLWLTPRCWERWIPHYEAQGYRVLAPGRDDVEDVVAELCEPPILIGHSTGGAAVQVLLDRGLGSVGVTLNSAPTAGVSRAPLAQLRSTFPALKNPAHRAREFAFAPEDFRYSFGSEGHEHHAVPAPGALIWDGLLDDHEALPVDYDSHAPLLFVCGRRDRLIPPSVQRANAALYSGAELVEVDGPHLLPVVDGWEAIADLALDWVRAQRGVLAM